jgi:hypothetical protein
MYMKIEEEIEAYIGGDVNSWIRAAFAVHKHWSPTNNDDSTVI